MTNLEEVSFNEQFYDSDSGKNLESNSYIILNI